MLISFLHTRIQDGELGTAGTSQTEAFNTAADVDFLFDFSPLTAEIHDLTEQRSYFARTSLWTLQH